MHRKYTKNKMSSCRTCLSVLSDQAMDFSQLPKDLNELKSYSDIIFFCLSIEIPSNCDNYAKVCEICYGKIIDFYKFKSLALDSDKYWRSLDEDKNKILVSTDIKFENISDFDNDELEISHLKQEFLVKNESDSDNELLSVIKKIKYEYNEDAKEKENEAKKVKAKRKNGKHKDKTYECVKKSVICEICGKVVRNMRDHMISHTSFEERKKIPCKVCEKTFNTIGGRNAHYRHRHLGIKQHCDICNKDVVSLKSHLQLTHKTVPKPYKCVLCESSFVCRSQLDVHLMKHAKHKPFRCDQPDCDKAFYTKKNLQFHIRGVHEKEKSHLCQFCSKGFFKKSHLLVHLRTHSPEKNFKCDECGNFYKTQQTLRYHKETHVATRAYPCQLCDNTFAHPKYLKVHMVSHTRERRYPCKYCGVRFMRSDHRLRHQKTAHEKHMDV
ncbi:zinc finger protein 431-like [Aricia agestis]|uniref:zinc finger protein 431-like n=1 Tax=Aricia agestis TaxID=91739 RepID=UPI001C202077|nr:zinc finger protein 431-like [Aricia agestis]